MADLELRFDEITEKYNDRQLSMLREYARTTPLPARVSLEIGSNKGRLIRALAQRHPEKFFLGIEYQKKLVRVAARRLRKKGLTNAHVLHANAELALPILIDDGQIAELFVYYPDPWWKKRHRKRRIIRPDTLDLLSPKLAPGAPLWIRTDVGPFANDMRGVLNAHPDFEPLPLEDYPLEPFPYSERDVVTIDNELPVHLLYYRRKLS